MNKILFTYTALVTFILTSLLGAIVLPLENQHSTAATNNSQACFKWSFDAKLNGETISQLQAPSSPGFAGVTINVTSLLNIEDYGALATPISAVKVIDPYDPLNSEDDLQAGLGKALILDDTSEVVNDTFRGGNFIFTITGGSINKVSFDLIDAGDEIDGLRINHHYYKVLTQDGDNEPVLIPNLNGANIADNTVTNSTTRQFGSDITMFVVHVSGSTSLDNLEICGTVVPSSTPTPRPTVTPTVRPSATPTTRPTATPTTRPSATPTTRPSTTPTIGPSATPTTRPSATPTTRPSATPTTRPSTTPTTRPSATPTTRPSTTPTIGPSATPTIGPSATPTIGPSITPTFRPSDTPTITPSVSVTPTVRLSITPTASPVVTPTPRILGTDTVFGFNLSKSVVGKSDYLVGEFVTFKVTLENTGTEPITRIHMRDVYTTDMRVSKIYIIQNGQRIDVTQNMITDRDDIDDGMILPSASNNKSNFLNLTDLTGILKTNDKVTFDFVFLATGKNQVVCNQAFASANFRREISSQNVCVKIDTIIPVTD